jgi:hypothetical protein
MSYDQQNNLKIEKFKVFYDFNELLTKQKYRGLSKELADIPTTDINKPDIDTKQKQLPIIIDMKNDS